MAAVRDVLPRLGSETSLDAVDLDGLPATLIQVGRIENLSARTTDPGS